METFIEKNEIYFFFENLDSFEEKEIGLLFEICFSFYFYWLQQIFLYLFNTKIEFINKDDKNNIAWFPKKIEKIFNFL